MSRESVFNNLPKELRDKIDQESFFKAEELRIRVNYPAIYYTNKQEYITDCIMTMSQIKQVILALSEHSLTSFFDEIRQGYFTISGGIRIGVAGRVVSERGMIKQIRDYTSLNIRFPSERKGVHWALFPYLNEKGTVRNTIIASKPQHGKTTLLRDLVRAISSGEGYLPQKCVVVDERSEIAGGMNFDVGMRTDVLDACPKAEGMSMALRALSPSVIATDELAGERDVEAIYEAVNSGVTVLSTVHVRSFKELENRTLINKLLHSGVMERIVLLSDTLGRGTVLSVISGRGEELNQQPFLLKEGI